MRHAILGPGGVGGMIAAVLADGGEDVTLIVRPGTESRYPRQMSLESTFKNLRAPVSVSSGLKSPVDVLWITVKATQLQPALESVPRNVQANAIVPLLNGVDHVEGLRARFGHEQVIAATIAVESERVAPGRIVHRSPFVRFAISEEGRERLAPAVHIFKGFGFECLTVAVEATLMWSKLVFLAPMALSTSAAQCTIGEVLSNPDRASRLETAVREACAVATQSGAQVDADAVLARMKTLPAGMRSSMEKDIANGNPPELDAIAGPILRGAEKHGIPLRAIPELVRTVEELSSARR